MSSSSLSSSSSNTTKIDASEHPEYIRLMSQLDQSKNERLQKVENWRKFERQSILDWFTSQKKQAWDDFYVSVYIITNERTGFKREKVLRCTIHILIKF